MPLLPATSARPTLNPRTFGPGFFNATRRPHGDVHKWQRVAITLLALLILTGSTLLVQLSNSTGMLLSGSRNASDKATLAGARGRLRASVGGRRGLARFPAPHLTNLVIVACHSVYTGLDFSNSKSDSSWYLLEYQKDVRKGRQSVFPYCQPSPTAIHETDSMPMPCICIVHCRSQARPTASFSTSSWEWRRQPGTPKPCCCSGWVHGWAGDVCLPACAAKDNLMDPWMASLFTTISFVQRTSHPCHAAAAKHGAMRAQERRAWGTGWWEKQMTGGGRGM
jgi:hypothetical protein